MSFLPYVASKEAVADLVKLLLNVQQATDDSSSVALFTRHFGAPTAVSAALSVNNQPAWSIMRNRDYTVVLIGGVGNLTMYNQTISGWSDEPGIIAVKGWNEFAYGLARQLFPTRGESDISENARLILVGHSLGGMIAECLNYQRFIDSRPTASLIVTTGAPRALASYYGGEFVEADRFRFMLAGDTIPSWPPRFDEAPALVLVASGYSFPLDIGVTIGTGQGPSAPSPLRVWPRFAQGPGGIALQPGGLAIAQAEPTVPAGMFGVVDNSLANWQAQQTSGLHLLTTYASAVHNWQKTDALLEPLGSKRPEPLAPEPPSFIPQLFLPQNEEGQLTLPLQGDFPMGQPNPINTGTQPGTDGGQLGTLFLRGSLIGVFPNRSRARTAARHLNRFLAKLPIALEVSVSGMSQGILDYLADAATGKGVDKKPVRLGS